MAFAAFKLRFQNVKLKTISVNKSFENKNFADFYHFFYLKYCNINFFGVVA